MLSTCSSAEVVLTTLLLEQVKLLKGLQSVDGQDELGVLSHTVGEKDGAFEGAEAAARAAAPRQIRTGDQNQNEKGDTNPIRVISCHDLIRNRGVFGQIFGVNSDEFVSLNNTYAVGIAVLPKPRRQF